MSSANHAQRSTANARTGQPHGVPTKSVAGDSPVDDAAVPFWITTCVRLMPPRRRNGAEVTASVANATFPAAQALIADQLRTQGDTDTPLNRDQIARRCGLGAAKKTRWLFDYLELIGFLRVHRHYDIGRRGRNRDTFTVCPTPPRNYIGPRTGVELDHALANAAQGDPVARIKLVALRLGAVEVQA